MNAFELGFREGLAKAAARSAEDVAHDITSAAFPDRAAKDSYGPWKGRVGKPPGVGSGEWRQAIEGAAARQARTARGRSVKGTAKRVLRMVAGRGLTGKQKAMRAAAAALTAGGIGAAAVHGSKPSYQRLGEKPKKR